jgi:hypothetical protein
MTDQTGHPSVGLLKGNVFRGLLLGGALCCFALVVIGYFMHRDFVAQATPATIRAEKADQAAPTEWTNGEHGRQALFRVRMEPDQGEAFVHLLYLSEPTIESLRSGGSLRVVYLRDNPRRHFLEGDPTPTTPWGWLVPGVLLAGLFAWSLRLR